MKPASVHKAVQLKPGEEILAVVHESLVPHAPRFASYLLAFLLPFFLMFPLFRLGTLGVGIFFLLVALAAYLGGKAFFKWANTVLVITDKRLIDIDQKALFDRVVSEVPYGLVDDVSYRVKGVMPTICRYGIVRVQTAGAASDIEFSRCRGPARVHSLINDLRKVIEDEESDRKERMATELAGKMSFEEIEELDGRFRRRERDEALETLYADDHAEDA